MATTPQAKNKKRMHIIVTLIAIYCLVAGLSEMYVGLAGNWLGILAKPLPHSGWTALVGSFYALGGLALLMRKKWSLSLGATFIGAEAVGRFILIPLGVVPSHGTDLIEVIIGAAIAVALIIYLLLHRKWYQ